MTWPKRWPLGELSIFRSAAAKDSVPGAPQVDVDPSDRVVVVACEAGRSTHGTNRLVSVASARSGAAAEDRGPLVERQLLEVEVAQLLRPQLGDLGLVGPDGVVQ